MHRGALKDQTMKIRTLLPTSLLLLVTACGGEDIDIRQPVRDAPTASVIPFVCRVTAPLPVAGQQNPIGTIIQSLGRDDLVVSDVRLVSDIRNNFSLQGAEGPNGAECSDETPCTVPFNDDVAISLLLEPGSRGWDYVEIEAEVNLPDSQLLSIPVVAFSRDAAEPDTTEMPSRPEEARCLCVSQQEFEDNGC